MEPDQKKKNIDGIVVADTTPSHSHKKVIVIITIALVLLVIVFITMRYLKNSKTNTTEEAYEPVQSLKELKTTSLPITPPAKQRATELNALSKTSAPAQKRTAQERADFIKSLDQ